MLFLEEMEHLLTMISAFFGGTFALLVQWYVFRNERHGTRSKVLYYLLEIYGNIYRMKKLKSIDSKYSKVLNELGILEVDAREMKSKIMYEINQEVYTDVFDELDDLNEHYPKIVDELSKENPTLAYYISGHGKSLDKMIGYLDRITEAIKKEVPKNEHQQIDQIFTTLFQYNFIEIAIDDIRSSIELLSKNISFREVRKVNQVFHQIEDLTAVDEEIEARVKSFIALIK